MDCPNYRIVAFYDSETNNIEDVYTGHKAFPIVHQLGIINRSDIMLKDIDASNVEDVVTIKLYRHTFEACQALDALPGLFADEGIVPVVAVHNLGFDMYSLSDWLMRHEVKVLAKSSTKPISFQILDEEGMVSMIIWDSLQFSGKSLARMGADCGYPKLKGSWDYERQRTPETPLTEQEIAYAKHDIYALAAWFGFWCRNNPDIDEGKLGINVTTKTGIVREKRKVLFSSLKAEGSKHDIGRFWYYQNRKEMPKSDDELFTMQACTRGGFTFCSSRSASVVFDLHGDEHIYGYDATSMHPSCMVSHAYPENFSEASVKSLEYAARTVKATDVDWILNHWYKPFPTAFNACFEFENLRPKSGTPFEANGIYPLAYARMSDIGKAVNDDNEAQSIFMERIGEMGYRDLAIEPEYSFGKLVSARRCRLWLTELAFWEVCQCYDFDSVKPVSGYITSRFCKPTDMSIASVMHFYTAKRVLKDAAIEYEKHGKVSDTSELEKYAPAWLSEGSAQGTIDADDLKLELMSSKQSLNGLFGVECTNEYRDDTYLSSSGISYMGNFGMANAPKNPKSWYQFGQRIVGWSRIMQNIAIQLVSPHCKGIVCGDTDSLKLYSTEDKVASIDAALARLARSIDRGKFACTARIRKCHPSLYDSLDGIGYYMQEFKVRQFCASWNKAYVLKEHGRYNFTIAGITTDRRYIAADDEVFENSYNDLAAHLEGEGWSFADICNLLLGYNIQIDSSITKINGRRIPEWGSNVFGTFTDYLGNSAMVAEPASLALFNMPKLVGGQDSKENAINMRIASDNNPDVNTRFMLLRWRAFESPDIIAL